MLTLDEVAERVHTARVTSVTSVAELAGLTGMSREAIYKIERGERYGSIATYMLIADALGITVGELLGDTRDDPRGGAR